MESGTHHLSDFETSGFVASTKQTFVNIKHVSEMQYFCFVIVSFNHIYYEIWSMMLNLFYYISVTVLMY